MVAAPALEDAPPCADDPVLADIEAFADRLRELVGNDRPAGEATRIDRIAALERMRSVVAAAESAEMVRFGRAQVSRQLAEPGFDPDSVGKGVVDQIALACRISPSEGSKRVVAARALVLELPGAIALLARGAIHERVALDVVRETRHLDSAGKAAVDQAVAGQQIERLGCRAAQAAIGKAAYEFDRAAYVARGRAERKQRRVTLRPAPDTMTFLTGYLPVEQGVACWAALGQAADSARARGDERSRGQVMADTLVERVTGQQSAADVNVELQLVMPLTDLIEPNSDDHPVAVTGHGWLPAPIARDILASSRGRLFWRRLFTAPVDGADPSEGRRTIVGGDQRRRRFGAFVRRLITARDQTCRVPYCDAPIRHIDHIISWVTSRDTSLSNGQGLCERHNLVKELPDWQMEIVRVDVSVLRTPTGHQYAARSPDPP